MKRKKAGLQCTMTGLALLVLIFDSNLALEGARKGVDLCITTVIPSLLPFFVLSMILTNTLNGSISNQTFYISRYFSIPPAAASVLIPSVLGGYPVGAKCAAELYRNHQISKAEAERLLTFCNNAGPAFIFGMISVFFSERKQVWLLWCIHIISALLTAKMTSSPAENETVSRVETESFMPNCIMSAVKAMSVVCCWVILFRIFITFLNSWLLWLFPSWLSVLIIGLLELTNGCCELMMISDEKLRFVLCECMLSFGGMCVLLQTASVTAGLSLKSYVKGKVIQTVFSFLISISFFLDYGCIIILSLAILLIYLRKCKIVMEIPKCLRYNRIRKIPEA